jgi:hypothetical protein
MTEDSAQLPVASAVSADHMQPEHLRKEGWTMALYVSICLIAALTALETVTAVPGHISGWYGAPRSVWLLRMCSRSASPVA